VQLAAHVATELLHCRDETLVVQHGEQFGRQIGLRVERVVVRGDRQPRLVDLAVVLDDGPRVGVVRVRRQRHDGLRTGLGRLLGPPPGLEGAVGPDTRHDGEALRGGLDRHLDDLRALLRGEDLVLAQRPVRDDTVGPVPGQPPHVLGVRVEVDGQVVAVGQGGRDEHAVPGAGAGSGHAKRPFREGQ
jgi:hypothetical protein